MTSNQPTEQPQTQTSATARSGKRNTPELWFGLGTALVLIPLTTEASEAAIEAGVSPWVLAVVETAIAVASFILLKNGTGRARDGVLWGLWFSFALAAVGDTALALDVSETWIMMALLIPVLAYLVVFYYRHGDDVDPF